MTTRPFAFIGLCFAFAVLYGAAPGTAGQVRTYYIAADEVNWNYAPSGIDKVTGKPFDAMERVYMAHSRPYSMHPHGVFYAKDSEGMAYSRTSSRSQLF
jgi:hypothetical protein